MINNYKNMGISGIRKEKISQNHFIRSDLMMTDLKMLRDADISACNAEELVDLRNVTVNKRMPSDERTSDFIGQIRNPYLFKVDDTLVKVEFGDGKDFSELLADVILAG